jgi:tRNA-dihydrouridine synthase 2
MFLARTQRTINYRNAKILAPMVRIGVLPFRMIAEQCGADIVYSEELVDKKLLACTRSINEETGVVEYTLDKQPERVVYSTSPTHEPKPLVLQIGTSSAELALQVAEKIYYDYDAIDINCGCPKHFSISGNMGAALLKDRVHLCNILSTLVKNISDKAVTCKIRLLENVSDTINLMKHIEQTGVQAIAVHARYVPQRPRVKAHLDVLGEISHSVDIPIIANGDCFAYQDIDRIKQLTKCDSVMIARGAIWNPAIFASDPVVQEKWSNPHYVALKMLDQFEQVRHLFTSAKYIICRTYGDSSKDGAFLTSLSRSSSYEEMRCIIGQKLL